ncbi:uncharacterized protein LOC133843205 [Drosophila sulfurigaster albostrigata]|uniref:uncharacterized protein LOC133843205 n=1 Tax=Drosophila sulfurigaster albostrigata TaxID=89887 RepID=UPI002D21C4E7|nr:uncharacterized protein LOC133843205 [Drosophila sulfurigaster albostrigata]
MRALSFSSLYLLLLGILLRSSSSSAWRSFKVVFTRFEFEPNAKFLDVRLEVENDDENSALNAVINVLQPLDDVELSISIGLQGELGNYTNIVSRSTNFCKMLKDRSAEPLTRIIYQDMLRFGKLFKECPLPKGTYTLRGYHIDEELLPSFLPETNFQFGLQLTQAKGQEIFHGTLHGRIDKSKGFNNLKMFSLG